MYFVYQTINWWKGNLQSLSYVTDVRSNQGSQRYNHADPTKGTLQYKTWECSGSGRTYWLCKISNYPWEIYSRMTYSVSSVCRYTFTSRSNFVLGILALFGSSNNWWLIQDSPTATSLEAYPRDLTITHNAFWRGYVWWGLCWGGSWVVESVHRREVPLWSGL